MSKVAQWKHRQQLRLEEIQGGGLFQFLPLLLYQEEPLALHSERQPAGGAEAKPHPDLRIGSSLGASSGRSGAELLLLGNGQGAVHRSGLGESGLHPGGHQEVWHLLPLPLRLRAQWASTWSSSWSWSSSSVGGSGVGAADRE